MAKADVTTPAIRSPRGTKPVSQAFFSALDLVPEASRAAVAKAAQAMIRDELKLRREKLKAAAAKQRTRKPAAKPPVVAASPPAAPKRRGRKQSEAETTA